MKYRYSPIILAFIVVIVGFALPATAFADDSQTGNVVHVVQRGETLNAIAARYGVSMAAVAKANGIQNRNVLYAGQRLNIPTARNDNSLSEPAVVAPRANRWIEVDLSQQRLYAHEGDQIVFKTRISSGLPRTPTPVGRYAVRTKIRSQTMSGPDYHLPNVQWVMYFYRDYALHGTYWHRNFGHPMSHGCVNLANKDARFLYNWASHGTPVIVHR